MEILKTEELKKIYKKDGKLFIAVDSVNITVDYGQCVGLVGESGCGKSTIAKLIMGIEKSTSGNIILEGNNITNHKRKQRKELYKTIQMVFQNPVDSFNQKMTLGKSIGEIKINFGEDKKQLKDDVIELLEMVGLSSEYYNKYPSNVSGGECQRAAIARALAIKPKLIVCDEITSALDVSVQAQIVSLLKDLQQKFSLSYMFISHDLALVKNICDKVYVMYRGNIVEYGTTKDVMNNPKHPYTKLLLQSISLNNLEEDLNMNYYYDDVDLLTEGCKFYSRCMFKNDTCSKEQPILRYIEQEHYSACHLGI